MVSQVGSRSRKTGEEEDRRADQSGAGGRDEGQKGPPEASAGAKLCIVRRKRRRDSCRDLYRDTI
jgi:hypothetical protein